MSDPLRLSLSWLTQADNVDVTDTGQLVRCKGYARSTTNTAITGAYATEDGLRLYVVDSGELRHMHTTTTYSVLRSGLSSDPMYFAEVAGKVFYTNGTDYGLLEPGGHRAWGTPVPDAPIVSTGVGTLDPGVYQVVCTYTDDRGLESGNSTPAVISLAAAGALRITSIPQSADYTTNVYITEPNGTVFFLAQTDAGTTLDYNDPAILGVELPFQSANPPRGSVPAFFRGRLYCMEVFPQFDLTVIWRSLPLHLHHFDLGREAIAVPGLGRMLKATEGALIIGTDRKTYAYDEDKLDELCSYGVVPGIHATKFENQLYWWSERGLCQALPFVNLTELTVSVAPGASAGAAVVEKDGQRRYVVALQTGGNAYNSRA